MTSRKEKLRTFEEGDQILVKLGGGEIINGAVETVDPNAAHGAFYQLHISDENRDNTQWCLVDRGEDIPKIDVDRGEYNPEKDDYLWDGGKQVDEFYDPENEMAIHASELQSYPSVFDASIDQIPETATDERIAGKTLLYVAVEFGSAGWRKVDSYMEANNLVAKTVDLDGPVADTEPPSAGLTLIKYPTNPK